MVNETALNERVIIVTGGGSGLGRAMSIALAEAGARVVLAEINRQHAEEALDEARQKGVADRVRHISTDVTDAASADAVVDETVKAFGGLFGLVNCAGIGYHEDGVPVMPPPPFYELKPAGWRQVVDVNLNGPFFMARAATPHMLKAGQGRIVNVTTSYGTMQRPRMSPYGQTKAAPETATMIWARELDGSGVTVNVLIPGGAADTRLIPDAPGTGMRGPGNKLASPEVMKAPIVWLMSDASAEVTCRRFIGKWWNPDSPPDEAASKVGRPAGWPVPEGQGGDEDLAD
ncbi:MAG: SDR family oxidoreductase [Pseudomonadota bacterium]|nr:SDR family oxidoreductase [Pseudomonadota bacterium]